MGEESEFYTAKNQKVLAIQLVVRLQTGGPRALKAAAKVALK